MVSTTGDLYVLDKATTIWGTRTYDKKEHSSYIGMPKIDIEIGGKSDMLHSEV